MTKKVQSPPIETTNKMTQTAPDLVGSILSRQRIINFNQVKNLIINCTNQASILSYQNAEVYLVHTHSIIPLAFLLFIDSRIS